MSAAVIESTRIAAAHEGIAELVVTLRYANGGRSEVPLDEAASAALLLACKVSGPEELKGHSWEKVRDALSVSWNRFTNVVQS